MSESFRSWAQEHAELVQNKLRFFVPKDRPLVYDAMRIAFEAGWMRAVDRPPFVKLPAEEP